MVQFFCDGSSRRVGRERHGFIGVVGIRDNRIVVEHSAPVGIATSNEAEYYAIIGALSVVKRLGESHVRIYSDSELVVGQLSGEYRILKHRLARLAETFQKLSENFENVTVEYGTNTRAHILAWSARKLDRVIPLSQQIGD